MTKKDLEYFREKLEKLKQDVQKMLWQKEKVIGTPQQEASSELSRYPLHIGDLGTDEEFKEEAAIFSGNYVQVLHEIDEALEKISRGEYGICELCGKEIESDRLDIKPYAKYCIECQRKVERGEV